MADSQETSTSPPERLTSSLPLAGETVAFTGTLASMRHREAARLVETCGGKPCQNVSGMTTMLVVGEEGWPLEADGRASEKLRQAAQLIADGASLRIVAESEWLHLIGLNEQRDEIKRSYTPAMLSRLLQVPVRLIRRWARIGLIHPVRSIGRLPYFDYREVTSARRLARLLDDGVDAATIENSLAELSQTLKGTDRSLAQLNLLVQDEKVVIRDRHGMLLPRTGQRLLDFDGPARTEDGSKNQTEAAAADQHTPAQDSLPDDAAAEDESPVSISITEARLHREDRSMQDWSADEWFNEGCRLAEEAAFDAAVNAFRNCLTLLSSEQARLLDPSQRGSGSGEVYPDPADVHFHMADALYRNGQTEAAIERYYCAIEMAPDFIEAWTQLGCLLTERGSLLAAEEALLTAISIHDANPDALLHYAQLLELLERHADAARCWEQYLQFDSRGPWADHARKQLERATQSQQSNSPPDAPSTFPG